MPLSSNIARRAGSASYYARVAIPKDLRPHYPRTPSGEEKRELWQSLRTKNAGEARARVHAVLDAWHREFEALRRRLAAVTPTEADLTAATWDHYREELDRHHADRRTLPTSAEIDTAKEQFREDVRAGRVSREPLALLVAAVEAGIATDQAEFNRDNRTRRKAVLERHVATSETALVADAAREIITRHNYAIEEDTPAWRDLCHRLLRAELEGLRRAEEQDRGDFTGRPRDPIVKPSLRVVAAPVAAPGEGIAELLDAYAADNRARLTPDTLRVNRQVVGLFAEFAGPTLPVSAIDKKQVFAWKNALRRYPIRASEITAFKGMGFKRIIEENERVGRPTLSDKTVNRYLSALGGFCTWAHDNGLIDANPVAGTLIKKDKDKQRSKIRPYTADQLTTIFASPLFTGCLDDGKEHKPGNVRPRDHRYWLPLLALFTGARMGELAQLLVADVRQDRGRWIIHVTREGDDAKSTKTQGSQRVVPMHPELERLGFLAFHAERAAASGKRLFPEIKPDARGQLAGHYSRFWGRYVKRIGVKNDATVNFHSFRHGFADALRRAGFRDEEFGFLLGHAKASTTGRYGILSEGELTQRCTLVDAVSFPELDLSHLWR